LLAIGIEILAAKRAQDLPSQGPGFGGIIGHGASLFLAMIQNLVY
jgi:hypothetical protein